jgi:hypothetical protein
MMSMLKTCSLSAPFAKAKNRKECVPGFESLPPHQTFIPKSPFSKRALLKAVNAEEESADDVFFMN